MFQKKNKPTPEELAIEKQKKLEKTKQELQRQVMMRRKTCEQIKGEIDRSRSEASKSREDAIRALEAGDELEAKRLCSIINIQNTAIGRKTKIYLLNLKTMELLGQKLVFLDTFDPGLDLGSVSGLVDDNAISELQRQLEQLDIDIELMTSQLEEGVSSVGTNDVFEELVGELKRQREIDSVGGIYPDEEVPIETEQFKVNRHF